MAAWLVALGAKEMAATLPLLLLMTDALLGRPSGWWRPRRLAIRYGPYTAVAVAYVWHRWSVLDRLGAEEALLVFLGAPLSVRGPIMLKVGAAYVGRLLFPVNLNASWAMPNASGLTDGALPLLALALLVGLVGLAWAIRRTAPPVAWGILWAGLALLPVSNIVPIGELGAERFLYFSSLGACVALAWGMTRGVKPLKEDFSRASIPLAGALGCAVLVLFAVNTIDRNRDWANDLVLWEKTVRQSPQSHRANHNLSAVLRKKGRYAEAKTFFNRSLVLLEKDVGQDNPRVATTLTDLAAHYDSQGQYVKAEALLKRALAIREKALGPDHHLVAQSLNNLASVYHVQGQYAEAEPLYKRALAIQEKAVGPNHPNVAVTLENMANLYMKMGLDEEAKKLLDRARRIRASQ